MTCSEAHGKHAIEFRKAFADMPCRLRHVDCRAQAQSAGFRWVI